MKPTLKLRKKKSTKRSGSRKVKPCTLFYADLKTIRAIFHTIRGILKRILIVSLSLKVDGSDTLTVT